MEKTFRCRNTTCSFQCILTIKSDGVHIPKHPHCPCFDDTVMPKYMPEWTEESPTKQKYAGMTRKEFLQAMKRIGFITVSRTKRDVAMIKRECSDGCRNAFYLTIHDNEVVVRTGTWTGAAKSGKVVDKFTINHKNQTTLQVKK